MGKENYRLSRSYDVLEAAAENEGGMGAAMGLGAGVGIGNAVGVMASKTLSNGLNSDEVPPPLPKAFVYHLGINDKSVGPMDYDAVCQKYSTNEINKNTLIWRKGMKAWDKICNVEDFHSLFDEECPPPLPTI